MIKYILILTLLTTNNVLADDALFLDKDQKAPYSGVLMPESKVVELRNNTLERDTLKLQNDSLNVSLKLQDDIIANKTNQVSILLDQNDKLAKTAYNSQSLSTWEKIGYFSLGIVVTGLAISGVHALYK